MPVATIVCQTFISPGTVVPDVMHLCSTCWVFDWCDASCSLSPVSFLLAFCKDPSILTWVMICSWCDTEIVSLVYDGFAFAVCRRNMVSALTQVMNFVFIAINSPCSNLTTGSYVYNTIWCTILTCAQKPTWISLIYHTESTAKKKCKKKKVIQLDVLRSINRQSRESMESVLKNKMKVTVRRIYRKGRF